MAGVYSFSSAWHWVSVNKPKTQNKHHGVGGSWGDVID
jgi:hypothetical protein